MAIVNDLFKAEEIFEACWYEAIQEIGEPATTAKSLKKINYNDFVERINCNDKNFIREFVFSFYSGIVFIFTETFPVEVLIDLKEKLINWSQKQTFTDSSTKANTPDSITARDWHSEDHGFGYSSTYNMIHFFRWNDDPVGAYKLFEDPFRLVHTINAVGIRSQKAGFEKIVDRIEVNHYPPVRGGIAFHSDPIDFARFIMTVNLTQFGVDYKTGGFGVGLGKGKILPIDPVLKIGSMVGFLPKVCHGVEIIDPHGSANPTLPETVAGRWYAALTMINTEDVKNREVTSPYPEYPTLREQISMHE